MSNALRILGRASLLVVCGLLLGCGSETYERRLEGTAKWHAHLAELDRELAKTAWRSGCIEYFRPPKGFEKIEPPAEDAESDPRQPAFVRGGLPGLLGAWTSTVSIEGSDQTADVYLFVVSNFDRYLSTKPEVRDSAVRYLEDLDARLARGAGFDFASVPSWKSIAFPAADDFETSKQFLTPRRDSADHAVPLRNRIDGREYEVMLFAFDERDAQGAVLCFAPVNRREPRRLEERLELALRTLEVDPLAPNPKDFERSGDGGKTSSDPGF